MADTSVSNSVLSIMASFTGGLDVFRKLRERRSEKRRRKRKDKIPSSESEMQLSRSLRQGPEDIGREYQFMGTHAGPHFAVGDATAQASLAEILLRLNTGLVGIIASFVSRDKPDRLDLDYRSLTDLSEHSRLETVGILRQLFQRLILRDAPSKQLTSSRDDRQAIESSKDRAVTKRTKVRRPTLARVVIQDSSRPSQLAIVRPTDGRKKSRSSSHTRSASASAAVRKSKAADSSISLPPTLPLPESIPREPMRPAQHRSKTAPAVPDLLRKEHIHDKSHGSGQKVPRHVRSTPRLPPVYEQLYTHVPPLPEKTKTPEPTSLSTYRHRKETPTFYSTATGSTKLGEIPMHKWQEPYDFDAMSELNREALATGWPLPLDNGQSKKKRGGLFGLFRRKQEGVV